MGSDELFVFKVKKYVHRWLPELLLKFLLFLLDFQKYVPQQVHPLLNGLHRNVPHIPFLEPHQVDLTLQVHPLPVTFMNETPSE